MCLSSAFCFFLYFLLAHSDHSLLATPFLTVPNWPSRTKVSQLCLYIILRLLNVKLPNWKLNMSAVRTGTKQSTGYQRNECMRVFCAVVRRRRCRRRRRRRMCVGIYSMSRTSVFWKIAECAKHTASNDPVQYFRQLTRSRCRTNTTHKRFTR